MKKHEETIGAADPIIFVRRSQRFHKSSVNEKMLTKSIVSILNLKGCSANGWDVKVVTPRQD